MQQQIKAQQFYTDLGIYQQCPTEKGLFKAFEWFSSTFQGRFIFKDFHESPLNSSTFQACANPAVPRGAVITNDKHNADFVDMNKKQKSINFRKLLYGLL